MSKIPGKVLRDCFYRSYMVNSAYNTRGLQNVGFTYAITPALESLYGGEGPGFSEALSRYSLHYNCHYLWTPLLLGAFLHLETAIAEGRFPASLLDGLKDTTTNTLSALGDSFFSGSVVVTWALITSLLILKSLVVPALCLAVAAIVLGQALRLALFAVGVKYGLSVLTWLGRLDLINVGDYLKLINSMLLLAILSLITEGRQEITVFGTSLADIIRFWFMPLAALGLIAWAALHMHFPRILALTGVIVLSGLFG